MGICTSPVLLFNLCVRIQKNCSVWKAGSPFLLLEVKEELVVFRLCCPWTKMLHIVCLAVLMPQGETSAPPSAGTFASQQDPPVSLYCLLLPDP